MRGRYGLTFKKHEDLWYYISYCGGQYSVTNTMVLNKNLLDCTVAGENRRLWALGRLIKAIIQVQLYKCSHLTST
jgi:hypothetical protein